jgi:hypothetical protein|tara:strand:- start:724 stop:867 length:144 start_codon:yes stop_codon:yes gene_type:complete
VKYLLLITVFLGGCGGGLVETVAINAGANIASKIVMDEVRGDCGEIQ